MNATEKYIDAIKAKTGAASDYRVAQLLEISRQQMSRYKNWGEQFSEETCVKAASILEIDPVLLMAEVGMSRAKNESTKAAWRMVFEKLGGVAAMCLLATGLTALQPAPVHASEGLSPAQDIYIIRNKEGEL